jgi:hypothetical protein
MTRKIHLNINNIHLSYIRRRTILPLLAHLGVGLAAKPLEPRIPTWILVVSAFLPDVLSLILFPIATPWLTHGLLMTLIWIGFAIGLTRIVVIKQNRTRKSTDPSVTPIPVKRTVLLIGGLILSHWILDVIGWPLTAWLPNSGKVPLFFDDAIAIGLGVYRTWTGALIMDLSFLVIGIVIYIKYRRNSNR